MSDSNDKRWFDKIRVNSWEVEILIVAVILAFLFHILVILLKILQDLIKDIL